MVLETHFGCQTNRGFNFCGLASKLPRYYGFKRPKATRPWSWDI